jgi:hypothetical protein
MPETAQYPHRCYEVVQLAVIQRPRRTEDPEAVEDAVQMGQVEELMEMAEDEQ